MPRLTFGCARCGKSPAGQLTLPELPDFIAPLIRMHLRKAGVPLGNASSIDAMLASVPPDVIGKALEGRCDNCLSLPSQGSPNVGHDDNQATGTTSG